MKKSEKRKAQYDTDQIHAHIQGATISTQLIDAQLTVVKDKSKINNIVYS